jgi:tripartite-type tricarboxylate transporter receptor subunit TctC
MQNGGKAREGPPGEDCDERVAGSAFRLALVAATLIAAAPATASAQTDFPRRAIKFVVPIPPGNMLDSMPRIVGEKLSVRWGQPVIVENRPGAASNLGTEAVFKAEPDGYTLLVAPPGPLVVSQHVYAKLGFDPASFVPVSTLIQFPFILVVNAKATVATLPAFIAHGKANPGKVSFGSAGVSSTPHLQMERFAAAAGVRFVHVHYPGLAPAMRDLLAGHIDAIFDTPGNVLPHIASGGVKALAVTAEKRIAELPDAPTISEVLPGIVHTDWFAVVAPPKTPRELATKLSEAIAETMKMPDVARRIAEFKVTVVGSSPVQTGALIKREAEQYRVLTAAAGIKIEK